MRLRARAAASPVNLPVVAVFLLLAACDADRSTPVTLRLWGLGREGEVAARLVPEFEAAHPGVRVHVQQVPWSAAHEKLLTAYVGGALPDVFQAGNTWLPELVTLGALAPVDGRIRREEYFPGIVDTNVLDGVLWGVPWYVDTRVLFYRRDLLAAAGIAEAPRTWADWITTLTRVTEPGRRYGIFLPVTEWQLPVILALQLDAALLRDDDTRGNFTSPAVRQAFTFYTDLFRHGLAPRGADAVIANVAQEFGRGLFVFYPTGPWNLGEFAARLPGTLADAWATAPLPAPDDRFPGASLAGGASLVVARTSAHAELAWELVAYLSAPAQQARLWELTGDLPARRDVWRDAVLARNRHAAAFWTQLQVVRATPKIPEWERIASAVARWAERAVREEVTVDEALHRLDRETDTVLEKRRWLREGGRAREDGGG